MRKRVFAWLMAVCMVVTLLPAALATEETDEVQVQQTENTESTQLYYKEVNTSEELSTAKTNLALRADRTMKVAFYADSTTETALTTGITGVGVTLTPVEGKAGFYTVAANTFGEASITFTDGDQVLTLPVTITRSAGWYTTAEPTQWADYIPGYTAEFNFSGADDAAKRTVYFVPWVETKVTAFALNTGSESFAENLTISEVDSVSGSAYVAVTVNSGATFDQPVSFKLTMGNDVDKIWNVHFQNTDVPPVQEGDGGNQNGTGGNQSGTGDALDIPQGNLATVGEYTIGFTFEDTAETYGFYTQRAWQQADTGSSGYYKTASFRVNAGVKKTGNGTEYYEMADNVDIVVKRVELRSEGGDQSYSLSSRYLNGANGPIPNNQIDIYTKDGTENMSATLWAAVDVTIPGSNTPVETQIAVGILRYYDDRMTFDCTSITSASELNAKLEQIVATAKTNADQLQQGRAYVAKVQLASTTYEGSIVIPALASTFPLRLQLVGSDDGATDVKGGIDLNGCPALYVISVNFMSDGTITSALYNGGGYVENCTFQDYDVAVNSTRDLINCRGHNLFVNNQIAVCVNTEASAMTGIVQWNQNTFVGNGIAIQIKSLGNCVPYNFRIYNCNFIDNGYDCDVQTGGKYYFYRNYFGFFRGNNGNENNGVGNANQVTGEQLATLLAADTEQEMKAVVSSRAPKLSKSNGSEVVFNPRWKFPVQMWWKNSPAALDRIFSNETASVMVLSEEGPYVNALTADWEMETEIVNSEAGQLLVDDAAFAESGTKQIDVVNVSVLNGVTTTTALGTWTFD